MKVVRRSLLSLFTMKVLLYECPIASWNLVLASCASTTFKPCKERFYSSYMKVVRRSLLSLFIIKVLLYEVSNREFESRVWCMKVVTRSLLSLFTITFCYIKFQSRAAISRWNHALAQHSNLVIRGFQLRAAISRWNHALAQHSNIVKINFIH